MNENQSSRIWRPVVEVTSQVLPAPGQSASHISQQQQVYTKTSLLRSAGEDRGAINAANLQNLNAEILSTSQAFNNSPKPFYRQSASTCASPLFGDISSNSNIHLVSSSSDSICNQQQQQQELDSAQQQVAARRQVLAQNSGNQQINIAPQISRTTQEENMSPLKLVHKQFNSPIDLYSMNNIRKTIEAHTELIAPGVKGINFMKPDTPVNKQSEVYKLVMEEENKRGQSERVPSTAAAPQRVSPISGQPLTLPRALITGQQEAAADVRYRSQQQHQVNQNAFRGISTVSQAMQQQQSLASQEQSKQTRTVESTKPPTCCECGQFIVGAFARIQNRHVHPHCFNCSTCGTSLKNTGYFTVNEKLYCGIHAKQVANMMQIKYNFGETARLQADQQQQVERKQIGFSSSINRTNQQSEPHKSNIGHQQQGAQSQPLASNIMTTTRQAHSSSTSPAATISTMFADRSHTTGCGSGDATWSWRASTGSGELQHQAQVAPLTAAATSGSSLSVATSSTQANTVSSSTYFSREDSLQHSPTPVNNGSSSSIQDSRQQHQVISVGTRGRGLLQESGVLSGGRLPVCTHCHVRIQGPYILAGRTTWCKRCSQTNFNCNSCRRSLLDTGFIEDNNSHNYYCEHCFEAYFAPICSKCNIRIKGDCLNALSKQWHPSCFVCGHCRRPFGNSSFYLEDNVPYCERDWSVLFTTKCYNCSYPIQAGDKWIEALERNYHANCFRCSSCQANLEGSTFYSKNGKPYCRSHAR